MRHMNKEEVGSSSEMIVIGESPSQYHFIHHKTHMDQPRTKRAKPLQKEARR
jgi:hypothetical protein